MKTIKKLMLLIIISGFLILTNSFSCAKTNTNPPPPVPVIATITTTAASAITATTATSGGNITSDGGSTITARGVCWNTSAGPTVANSKTIDGTGTGVFASSVTGLTAGTYYIRAYATNSAGTAYGNEIIFTTLGSIPSVTICTQVWMLKNLDVSTYRNGDLIPKVTDPTAWQALTTGAWCWYNNDSATYASTYCKFYNWYAVNDPRGLAPTGWHVPSDAEWTTLGDCLGGWQVAGGAMKETGTTHWKSPNTGATNSSGFTGLPGGYRDLYGAFYDVGGDGTWWSSTEANTTEAWSRILLSYSGTIERENFLKPQGWSVRCLRD